ncbi:RICIN domain-containing protein [Frankia sp. Cas3]|uniref:RICIN domain-containing protein n=1 Tax=Frankia sp. Cas3 TaxID=3073926 RepID=UPI002AD45612|nr:RICIN domain-containing protein [Frankia sp. Cas3]
MPVSGCRRSPRFGSLAVTLRALLSAKRVHAMFFVSGLALTVLMLPSTAAYAADQSRVEITNLRSGLKADVMWASQNPYQGVFLWPNNTSASQEFDLLDSGGGYFRIRARHSGQCLMLDWRQGTYTNGTRIIQYPYCSAGYSPAEWRRGWVSYPPNCSGNICSTTGTSYPVLINRRTGRCLDADNGAGGAPPARAVLQQWDCIRYPNDWNAGNQLWRIGNESYL